MLGRWKCDPYSNFVTNQKWTTAATRIESLMCPVCLALTGYQHYTRPATSGCTGCHNVSSRLAGIRVPWQMTAAVQECWTQHRTGGKAMTTWRLVKADPDFRAFYIAYYPLDPESHIPKVLTNSRETVSDRPLQRDFHHTDRSVWWKSRLRGVVTGHQVLPGDKPLFARAACSNYTSTARYICYHVLSVGLLCENDTDRNVPYHTHGSTCEFRVTVLSMHADPSAEWCKAMVCDRSFAGI
jgi:hypothetical protein